MGEKSGLSVVSDDSFVDTNAEIGTWMRVHSGL